MRVHSKVYSWLVALLACLAQVQVTYASWQINTVLSETGYALDITIGNGRNDGTNRIYAANHDYYMYEYTYNLGSWNRVQFGQNPSGGWAYQGVAVGQPTNYPGNILFAGNENYRACTFIYNAPFSESFRGLANQGRKTTIGLGRNTAITYAYIACQDNNIYEYYYNGSDWNAPTTVGSTGTQAARAVAVGQGRSTDSNYYVYGAGMDGRLYEFHYNGAPYVRTTIVNTGGQVNDIKVAAGRNGSTTRCVYAGNNNGQVWESFYNGASWQSNSITTSGIGSVNAIAIGDGRNDGSVRLYAATNNNQVYEFTWDGIYWSSPQGCGAPSANDIYSLYLGPGRNTSGNYLYAGSADYTVYEYEWIEPTTTPTPVVSATPSRTPSYTVTPTPTVSPTGTPTPTATETATPTGTGSVTATATPTATMTVTETHTVSATSTSTPSATLTPTVSLTATISTTHTPTSTRSPTLTISITATISPTATATPSMTETPVAAQAVPGVFTVFPNPGQDHIHFVMNLPEATEIKVVIYNINAELVATLQNTLPAGQGQISWDCRSTASGIFLARVYFGNTEVKKIKIAVMH